MTWGHESLAAVAVLLLLVRVGLLLHRRAPDEPTYADPELALDNGPEQAHDVFGELGETLATDREADRRYLKAGTDRRLSDKLPVSRKMVLTALVVWGVVLVPYAHPTLGRFRLLGEPTTTTEGDDAPIAAGATLPAASVGEHKLPGETYDQQARARELDEQAPDSRGPIAQAGDGHAPVVPEDKPPRSIEDPSGKALDKLFAKLTRVEKKEPGAVAHILYYGDSIVASDFVTGKLRRRLQSRFGDAGHGSAIIANAWPGWFHLDIARNASGEWQASTCVGPYAADGLYGLGCASFQSYFPNIWTEFGTASRDEWGRRVSRFVIEYLRQPDGGALRLLVDGAERGVLDTAAAQKDVAWHTVEVPDGPHTLRLETTSKKQTRLFGVRMERDVPGVRLTAAGITGARARFLDKQDDAHWAKVLAAPGFDLVALAFGSNETADGRLYPMEQYLETITAVMKQIEAAVPGASYMLVAPPDMASKNATWGHSRPFVVQLIAEQRKIAAARGWAFWDQYQAMGGAGSMWAWIKAGLGSHDMFHPTGRGGNLLGNWQYLALMEQYRRFKQR